MYKYPNYLMHHGIKGMKWGVRNRRYSGGVTKNGKRVSNRKAKKAILKKAKKPGQNQSKVIDAMTKEFSESKEFKEYRDAYNSGFGFATDQLNSALKKRYEIGQKYVDHSRSAMLKDIGFDDTKSGRDFIAKVANEQLSKNR